MIPDGLGAQKYPRSVRVADFLTDEHWLHTHFFCRLVFVSAMIRLSVCLTTLGSAPCTILGYSRRKSQIYEV